MSNYSDEPGSCRVDFFNPSGKWQYTEAVVFSEDDYYYHEPRIALGRALKRQCGDRYQGLLAVCLEPCTKYVYPVMLTDW